MKSSLKAMEKRVISVQRELSWLQFNERVLFEASDVKNPLVSRVHFLGIFSSNLDEFFKVRIASLNRELKALRGKKGNPLDIIHDRVMELQWEFDRIFENTKKALAKVGVHFKNERQLSSEQKLYVDHFFDDEIRHHIIPILMSSSMPLPPLKDNALYLVVDVVLKDKAKKVFALIEVPDSISRWVVLPSEKEEKHVMFLEDVIRYNLKKIFSIYSIASVKAYDVKVVRDAEYEIENDFSKSVFDKISKSIQQRSKGDYVRINFDHEIPEDLLHLLLNKTKIKNPQNIIPGGRYHNKKDLLSFPDFGNPDWVYPKLKSLSHPAFKKSINILDTFNKKDVLLQFPYQRFSHILDLLRAAAIDPQVRTIRISMYRIAHDSHILHALINAAKNGKKVVALVEVQARFDEAHNLEITKMLQAAGVKVIPGIPGLKVHCKVFQISRKINGRTVRITHIGTGNFHEKTARIYSDTSLLTTNLDLGREVRSLFHFFESNFHRPQFRHLVVSPFNTRRKLMDWISEEIKEAKKGKKALVVIKVNNLVDEGIIKKLLEAGENGVEVKLVVRGVCLLQPTSENQKKNISMRSILGRYLEHSRVFVFGLGKRERMLIGSADMMVRNLDYRIEVLAPILDSELRAELREWLNLQFDQHAKARCLESERINQLVCSVVQSKSFDTQDAYYQLLTQKSENSK
jgi:polyphosphate kinase